MFMTQYCGGGGGGVLFRDILDFLVYIGFNRKYLAAMHTCTFAS